MKAIPPATLNSKGEWEYPQIYYKDRVRVSKRKLLERAESNTFLQEAIRVEPRIKSLLEQVKHQKCIYGYNANETFYDYYKPRIVQLVGWEAHHKTLRTMEHYDAVYDAIYDLLPADEVDLYPDGIMPNEAFSPSQQEKYGREYP